MKVLKVSILGLFLFLQVLAQAQEKKARYVFLFIGDGMGLNQFYSTELYNASLKGVVGNERLTFSMFPVQSFVTTFSANRYITCSSAAGTALASGHKTNNNILGLSPDLKISYSTIAERAKLQGFKIGILSSVPLNHATPAAFYGHEGKRSDYYEIACQMASSNFDFFGGGGLIDRKGEKSDKPDAFELLKNNGYEIVNTYQKFKALTPKTPKSYVINPVTYSEGEFCWVIDKNPGAMSLAQITKKGIDQIENNKGFFMMVEGGKIDWACHANDAATEMYEVMAFDSAVNVAFNFYKQHPDETLILVTADHETGGLMVGNAYGNGVHLELLKNQKISGGEFEQKIKHLKEQADKPTFEAMLEMIKSDFGLGDADKGLGLSEKEINLLKESYNAEFANAANDSIAKSYLDNDGSTIAERVVYILNSKAGIGWTSHDHSASPVPIRAIGVGQERFGSFIDNTEIPKIIGELMGVKME